MKNNRYRIEKEDGNAHGDLYEMEITTYFYVIDNLTNTAVMTFTGEYFTTLGDNGWNDGNYSGVTDVKISEDGLSVLVFKVGSKEPDIIHLS